MMVVWSRVLKKTGNSGHLWEADLTGIADGMNGGRELEEVGNQDVSYIPGIRNPGDDAVVLLRWRRP